MGRELRLLWEGRARGTLGHGRVCASPLCVCDLSLQLQVLALPTLDWGTPTFGQKLRSSLPASPERPLTWVGPGPQPCWGGPSCHTGDAGLAQSQAPGAAGLCRHLPLASRWGLGPWVLGPGAGAWGRRGGAVSWSPWWLFGALNSCLGPQDGQRKLTPRGHRSLSDGQPGRLPTLLQCLAGDTRGTESALPAPLRGCPTAELTRPLQRRLCVRRPGLTVQTGWKCERPSGHGRSDPGPSTWAPAPWSELWGLQPHGPKRGSGGATPEPGCVQCQAQALALTGAISQQVRPLQTPHPQKVWAVG